MSATRLLDEGIGPSEAPEILDTRGLLCPYPFLRAKQALERLPPGSTLEILTDSEATANSSIPVLCEQNGYRLTSIQNGEEWRLLVLKP